MLQIEGLTYDSSHIDFSFLYSAGRGVSRKRSNLQSFGEQLAVIFVHPLPEMRPEFADDPQRALEDHKRILEAFLQKDEAALLEAVEQSFEGWTAVMQHQPLFNQQRRID